MFRNSRTPSPQTIELLRQLAYISGGALCGVTALYLEECRRRIRILQGVLDKRKAIVQVAQARRYSKVALAARSDAVDVDEVHALGYRPQSGDERSRASEVRTRPPRERDGSAIEASNSGPRLRAFSPLISAEESSKNNDNRQTVTPELGEFESKATHSPPVFDGLIPRASSNSTTAYSGQRLASNKLDPDISQKQETPQPRRILSRRRMHIDRGFTGGRERNVVRPVPSTSARRPPMRARSRSSRDQLVGRRITALVQRPMTEHNEISIKLSEALLPEALRNRTLKDIRTLCDWMLENGAFTIEHGRLLVESCPRLAKTSSSKDIFTLHASVLNHSGFGVADPEAVYKLKVRFLIHALNWQTPPTPTDYGRPILNNMSWSLDSHMKAGVLDKECKYLLSDMQIDRAADIFLVVARCSWKPRDPSAFSDLSSLADEIMQTALSGDLVSYKRLLQWKRSYRAPEELKHQFNAFVEACGRQRSFQLLAEFITRRRGAWSTLTLMNLADGLNKAIIAVAFSMDVQLVTTFVDVYRRVPEPFQQYVDEFASAESLRVAWKAKHNIDLIGNRAVELSAKLQKQGDEQTLLKVDEALLEIYTNEGDHDKAFECIARMHNMHHGNVHFLALTAVYFGRRWAWGGLTRLLEISKPHGPFTFDEYSRRLFNNVIRYYAQVHSSLETWTFITNAIEDLGFTPNFATAQLMLFKIVREKSIDLLPRWLRFMSAIGSSFDMHGHLADRLIRHYYLWNRQSSDLLFQLCHKLTASVPQFNAEHFRSTLKMVIGYDLRYGVGGGDGSIVQKEALALLEQLDTAKDVVPLPGTTQQQNHDTPVVAPVDEHTAGAPQKASQQSEEGYYQTLALFNDDVDPVQEEQTAILGAAANANVANEVVEDTFRRRASDSRGQHERVQAQRQVRKLEVDMSLALSLERYQEALDLYHGSCDAAGLPASPNILKHAIDASIRLHQGGTSHAELLIAEAKRSGMDVHRAVDPLLVHRSSNIAIGDVRQARRVCDATIEYYEENHRNGYPVKFALVHTVANTLTARGHAEETLRLLSTIFQSDYIGRIMPSIITLSVWIKAYTQLLSIEGIRWVAMRVLSQNLVIDSIFLNDFEKAANQNFKPEERELIRSWLRKFQERRREQDLEAKIFGNQLVDCIVGYVHKYTAVGRPPRPDEDAYEDIVVRGAKVEKGSTESTAIRRINSKKDENHHQKHMMTSQWRRSLPRAEVARSRSRDKLTVRVVGRSKKRSMVPNVKSVPGWEGADKATDLRSDNHTAFVPF